MLRPPLGRLFARLTRPRIRRVRFAAGRLPLALPHGLRGSKADSNDVRLASGNDGRTSHLKPDTDVEAFREKLFANVGTPTEYKPGEVIIKEGEVRRLRDRPHTAPLPPACQEPTRAAPCASQAMDNAVYIRKGTAVVSKRGKEIAKRSKGDLIGEMSLLLGDAPTATIKAETAVEVFIVQHSALTDFLTQDPSVCGRVFRMMASTLSERISEASAKMRSEVVAKNAKKAPKKMPVGDAQTLNVAKYRQLFNLAKDENLMLRTTCSARKESNALKDANVSFGDMYVFEKHLCFDWKVFGFHRQQVVPLTDVVALLKSSEQANTVDVQARGYSLEVTLPENFEEAWSTMEACRRSATAAALQQASRRRAAKAQTYTEVDAAVLDALGGQKTARSSSATATASPISMDLTESDWHALPLGREAAALPKGEYVLREGAPTKALYQILQGSLRVELQLKDQPTAVVVGHRGAGEMFGETSLLKASPATASIVTDSDEAILVCIDGAYLETLFSSHPKLPGRFFAFLATYQAKRLASSPSTFSSDRREVAGQHLANVPIDEIFATRRTWASSASSCRARPTRSRAGAEARERLRDVARHVRVLDGRAGLPLGARARDAHRAGRAPLRALYRPAARAMCLSCFSEAERGHQAERSRTSRRRRRRERARGASRFSTRRRRAAVKAIEEQCYSQFLASDHFSYILELKAKEGIVPGLPDFRLIRVLGQGGFGQVLEVVKRDCGKHYAMKVMHKEMMRRCLGSSWRKKIHLEKDLMASLNHPFLVNLSYAFQNTEFLVLVMDLVPAGDLSEFVLTEKRLTYEQVRFVVMEVVCVIGYCHMQNVLYRDLKPENLLIDEAGHVRMIDMGLAARISKKQPKRRSRVGTDCYMAPEVRWAKDRREPYGLSCDWYTVGVLAYEFSAGTVPYAHPEEENAGVPAARLQGPRLRELCALAAQPGPRRAPRLRPQWHQRDPRPPVLARHRVGPRAAQKVRVAVQERQGARQAQEGEGEPRRADRQRHLRGGARGARPGVQRGQLGFRLADRRRRGVHGEHVPMRLGHLSGALGDWGRRDDAG